MQPIKALRCSMMDGGIRARSPLCHCQAMKIPNVTAAPTRRPMTRAVSHACGSALYCMARKNITAVPRKMMLPIGSSSMMILVRGRAGGLSAG